MQDWKIHDNDIIVLVADKPTTSAKQPHYSNTLIADLVKSIRVPQDSMRRDSSDLKDNELAQVRFYCLCTLGTVQKYHFITEVTVHTSFYNTSFCQC